MTAMNNQTITTLQLEPYDDVESVRDRLTFVDTPRVLLNWPPQGRILTRKLDLLLVQRQAARLGLHLALRTDDITVAEHAHELNISVFPDEQTAQRSRWKRPQDKVFTPPPRDDVDPRDIVQRVARQRGEMLSPGSWRMRRIGRWLVFFALVAILGAGFLVAAPSATVTLTPASRQVFESVAVIADPNLTDIDMENYRMPAALVTLQATARVTVEATGTESGGASRAQGLVTFRNTTNAPILIPLGTVVATSGTFPIRFETLIETTLPAGEDATIAVPVQALLEHSGAEGNVNPGAINRVEAEFANVVSVTNTNATYGGARRDVKTVTQADHDRLLVLARQQVLQNARDTLLHQLSGDQFLVPGSLVIIRERPEWTLYNTVVGDIADSASLDLRADVQAVVVDEQQARQIAFAGIAPYVQPGLEISPATLTIQRGDILSVEPDGRVTFLMTVKGNVAVAINADQVRDRVTGLSVSAAQRRLESELLLDPTRPPQIRVWPPWFNRLPVLPVRITVNVTTP